MDPRSLRSQESLHQAVLTLAADAPIEAISVSELCQEAGVTRDTFYRHAGSPTHLLADALGTEIEQAISAAPEADSAEDAARMLLRHVQQRAAVYRGAMHPLLAAPVRNNLERLLRSSTELWVQVHPEIVPARLASDEAGLQVAVAFVAAGSVGAIEEWLRQDGEDIDRAVELILAAAPEWWLARPAAERSKP